MQEPGPKTNTHTHNKKNPIEKNRLIKYDMDCHGKFKPNTRDLCYNMPYFVVNSSLVNLISILNQEKSNFQH